jgi:hypothetical protein
MILGILIFGLHPKDVVPFSSFCPIEFTPEKIAIYFWK